MNQQKEDDPLESSQEDARAIEEVSPIPNELRNQDSQPDLSDHEPASSPPPVASTEALQSSKASVDLMMDQLRSQWRDGQLQNDQLENLLRERLALVQKEQERKRELESSLEKPTRQLKMEQEACGRLEARIAQAYSDLESIRQRTEAANQAARHHYVTLEEVREGACRLPIPAELESQYRELADWGATIAKLLDEQDGRIAAITKVRDEIRDRIRASASGALASSPTTATLPELIGVPRAVARDGVSPTTLEPSPPADSRESSESARPSAVAETPSFESAESSASESVEVLPAERIPTHQRRSNSEAKPGSTREAEAVPPPMAALTLHLNGSKVVTLHHSCIVNRSSFPVMGCDRHWSRTEQFRLVREGSAWFVETPSIPSGGYEATKIDGEAVAPGTRHRLRPGVTLGVSESSQRIRIG